MTTFSRIHPALLMFTLALVLAAGPPAAGAHGYSVGAIAIAHPFSVPTPPGATTGAGYLKQLSNSGTTDDRLVGASSPAADHVELHTMSMDDSVMRMREVPGIVVPAGGRVEMAPGNGYHLMLIGLRQPLKVGDRIPVRLIFANAGAVDVELLVQARGAMAGMAGSASH